MLVLDTMVQTASRFFSLVYFNLNISICGKLSFFHVCPFVTRNTKILVISENVSAHRLRKMRGNTAAELCLSLSFIFISQIRKSYNQAYISFVNFLGLLFGTTKNVSQNNYRNVNSLKKSISTFNMNEILNEKVPKITRLNFTWFRYILRHKVSFVIALHMTENYLLRSVIVRSQVKLWFVKSSRK